MLDSKNNKKRYGLLCYDCHKTYKREWFHKNNLEHPELRGKRNESERKRYSLNKEEKLGYKKKYKLKEGPQNLVELNNYICRSCGVPLSSYNCTNYSCKNFDFICKECLKKERISMHRKVMADYLGVPIEALREREVHHMDLNTNNNDIKNLILLTFSAHSVIHGKLYKKVKPIQKVYLAGPIDGVSEGIAQNWRTQAYDKLAQNAILSLVPGKETRGLLNPQEIVDLDTCMINNADAILVNLNFLIDPKLGRGSGTLAELGMAIACNNKPIVAFVNGDLGHNKFIKGMCSHVVPTLEEAVEILVSLNKPFDKKVSEYRKELKKVM